MQLTTTKTEAMGHLSKRVYLPKTTSLISVKDTEVWGGFDSLRGQEQLDVLREQRQLTQGVLLE